MRVLTPLGSISAPVAADGTSLLDRVPYKFEAFDDCPKCPVDLVKDEDDDLDDRHEEGSDA